MASQSDQEPKDVSGKSSSDTTNHPPPQTRPGYGPAMGYPPPTGYHQQGYQQGYPPPPYYNAYNHPDNPYNYHHQQQQLDARASNFVRGVFIGIILLVVFMASISIITWLVLRPELPVVHVNNFLVTNFNISKQGNFVATFEANVTIENPNTRLKLFLNEVTDFVYYDDHMVASSAEESFFMDVKTNRLIDAKIIRNDTNPFLVLEENDTENMTKDRSTGKIAFSYRIASLTAFKSGSWWTRHSVLKVYCEDLIVQFGNDNVGSMSGGKDCLVVG